MTQQERRIYLIQYLLAEDPRYRKIELPQREQDQKNLLRCLMNLRPPKPISEAFLRIQDEYLRTERDHIGVVDAVCLPTISSGEPIALWLGDITTLKADAIVNAANSTLLGCFHPLHTCIDNIIHTRSGVELRLCCNEIINRQGHEEREGQAKITPAYNLPSQYVIHTVGPMISNRVTQKDRELLASCYRSCLELAVQNGCKTLAFCCISTGEFHFPNQQAANIAVETVRSYLYRHPNTIEVIFNVFQPKDYAIYQHLLSAHRAAGR